MQYDIAIIGGGPGGYVAAIKAAQMKMSTICIDNNHNLGGTCLNVGCIPSKVLLNITQKFAELNNLKNLKQYGITYDNINISIEEVMLYKNKVINELNNGIKSLFKKNHIQYIHGTAKFIDKNTLNINGQIVKAQYIIIASGSKTLTLPNIEIDEKYVMSSTGILSLNIIPKHLVIIGGGVIGLEMASIWSRLNSKVTVIEYSDRLCNSDNDVSNEIHRILSQQNIEFIFNAKVKYAFNNEVIYQQNNQDYTIKDVNIVLVAVGRQPNIEELALNNIQLSINSRQQIEVNKELQTSISNIYAIGDVINGPMLAHKASEEAVAVIENICGKKVYINYDLIPNVIYTYPEIATIGKTERYLLQNQIPYSIGKFNFSANSRAKISNCTKGFVKILSHAKTDEILGSVIINPHAGEMIHEIAVAMAFHASSEDIARIPHSHPTMSEAIKEAMLATYSSALHN